MLDNGDFAQISALAHKILNKSLDRPDFQSWEQTLEAINQTTSLKVVRDWDLFTQLESVLVSSFEKLDLLHGIKGMEFPVNVRCAHGKAPAGYTDGAYATDFLHSDIWSGEPSDIVNCFIYVAGDLRSTYLELNDCSEQAAEELAAYRGPYEGAKSIVFGTQKVDYQPRPAQLILFDGACPHKTVRTGGGARISVDFRLRREDPYKNIDERWNGKPVSWSKYWRLRQAPSNSFRTRCESELSRLQEDSAAREKRSVWIESNAPTR